MSDLITQHPLISNSLAGLIFPNAKINFGLRILDKRTDDFHTIETIVYPIPFYDVIEWKTSKKFSLLSHGLSIPLAGGQNLIEKAYQLLLRNHSLPPLKIHLLKNIPVGAGMGGGSSDAVCFMQSINRQFQLGIDNEKLKMYSLELGSDCPFFVKSKPVFATGRGEKLKECGFFLKGYSLFFVFTGIHINTEWAYNEATPYSSSPHPFGKILNLKPEYWKENLSNDFEPVVFGKYPQLKAIKERLYQQGALYASLTGSGSSVYGIFEENTSIPNPKLFDGHFVWSGKLL